jgi:hypothetical protein
LKLRAAEARHPDIQKNTGPGIFVWSLVQQLLSRCISDDPVAGFF